MPKLPKITCFLFICNIYLKKEASDEVDSRHADNHESLLPIDTTILMGMVKHSQSSQNSKFAMSLQYLKKEVRDEVNFLYVDKISKFPTSWSQHLSINHPTSWYYQSTQSNNLQHLYNIWKKEVRNGVLYLFACRETLHTYQVSCIMWQTHTSTLFLTLTCMVYILSGMSCCVAFRVSINSKIQYKCKLYQCHCLWAWFKLDINANFTKQNGEWVFISVFFLLSTHLTPKERYVFLLFVIT